MPIPIIVNVARDGLDSIPWLWPILKIVPWLAALYAIKWWSGGVKNRSERVMHSKVVILTVRWTGSYLNMANFTRAAHPE